MIVGQNDPKAAGSDLKMVRFLLVSSQVIHCRNCWFTDRSYRFSAHQFVSKIPEDRLAEVVSTGFDCKLQIEHCKMALRMESSKAARESEVRALSNSVTRIKASVIGLIGMDAKTRSFSVHPGYSWVVFQYTGIEEKETVANAHRLIRTFARSTDSIAGSSSSEPILAVGR